MMNHSDGSDLPHDTLSYGTKNHHTAPDNAAIRMGLCSNSGNGNWPALL